MCSAQRLQKTKFLSSLVWEFSGFLLAIRFLDLVLVETGSVLTPFFKSSSFSLSFTFVFFSSPNSFFQYFTSVLWFLKISNFSLANFSFTPFRLLFIFSATSVFNLLDFLRSSFSWSLLLIFSLSFSFSFRRQYLSSLTLFRATFQKNAFTPKMTVRTTFWGVSSWESTYLKILLFENQMHPTLEGRQN